VEEKRRSFLGRGGVLILLNKGARKKKKKNEGLYKIMGDLEEVLEPGRIKEATFKKEKSLGNSVRENEEKRGGTGFQMRRVSC